jgi:hypothetical protein
MDRKETRKTARRLNRSAALLLALGGAGWLGHAHAAHTDAPTWSRLLGTSGHDQAVGAVASLEAVYVAGYTAGALPTNTSAGGFDAWVARYGTDGTLAWTRQLGSPSNDYVTGLAHHDAQAVALFVTGYTGGSLPGNVSAGGQDAFLARYDASGSRQWVRQLGSSDADFAQAVATDAAGNSYVTGYTSGTLPGQTSSGRQDFFLAKYDGAGNRLWVRQWGSADNDQGRGVAVDAAGQVYVTGFTWARLEGQTSAGGQDLFLAKYDGEGNRLWVRQVGTNGTDVAQALATSRRPSGEVDVYLVGRTTGGTDGRGLDGLPQRGGYDLVVLRYDAAGNRGWTRQDGTAGEDSVSGATADGAGNVYVTGSVSRDLETGALLGSNDVVMLKYGPDGVRRSARQLGSSGGSTGAPSDWGLAVAADTHQGVYVAGYVEGSLGNATSAGGKDSLLMHYPEGCTREGSPSQCRVSYGWGARRLAWNRQLGSSTEDSFESVVRAPDGSLYVAGQTLDSIEGHPSAGWQDSVVMRYGADGTLAWSRQLGSPGDDSVSGVALDGAGNVYVSGTTSGDVAGTGNAGSLDAFLVSFDANGSLRWKRQLGTAETDSTSGVAVDAVGNVYMAGTTDGRLAPQDTPTGLGGDLFLVSYDASGKQRWVRQFGASTQEGMGGIATGTDGHVYGVGYTTGKLGSLPNKGGWDVVLLRLSQAGALSWLVQEGTAGDDFAMGVATSQTANGHRIHVSATTTGALPNSSNAGWEDLALFQFKDTGVLEWGRQFGTNEFDVAAGLTVDGAGHVYVSGSTLGSLSAQVNAGGQDLLLLKYDSAGTRQWACLDGTDSDEYARAVATDATGSLTLVGATYGAYGSHDNQGELDMLLLHYANGGTSPCP